MHGHILLITFIAAPATSAKLLIISLLPSVLLAHTVLPLTLPFAPFLHLAVPAQPTDHDAPSPSQLLTLLPLLLPSHLLSSLISSVSAYLCWAHPHHHILSFCPLFLFIFSLLLHHLTCCVSYCLISPCLALLVVWHLPSPNSLHCLSSHPHPISFYCFICCIPIPLSPFPVVPQLCSSLCHPPLTPLCLPLLSLLLAALFPTLLLSFTTFFGQLHLLPVPSSFSPSSNVSSLQYLCLPLHLLLAPQMPRTCLRSPCNAIVHHYLLPHLPSNLPLLLQFSSSCQELPCLQTALTTSPCFPSAAHACSLSTCHHLPSSPNFSTYCFLLPLCIPCTAHLSSST